MDDIGQLRPISTDELELILSWRNAPGVRANMYTRHEISLDEHLAWWARTRERTDQSYKMFEREGTPLGVVGFTQIDQVNSNSSWAFYASPAAPAGTGSRMEFLALDFAFEELALHKLHCEVLAFNQPVIKLHHKFGFQTEGILRSQHLHGAEYIDIVRLGILSDEWRATRQAMLKKLQATNRH